MHKFLCVAGVLLGCTVNINVALAETVAVTLDGDDILWSAVPSDTYDLVVGQLGPAPGGDGDFETTTQSCLENDTSANDRTYTLSPPLGQAYWFFVRIELPGGTRTYDSEELSQTGFRDLPIHTSGNDCARAVEPDAVSAIIGSSGGILSLGLEANLAIPSGALTADSTIELERLTSNPSGAIPPGNQVGDYLEMRPVGQEFLKPVQLTMTVPAALPTGITDEDLIIWHSGTQSGQPIWEVAGKGFDSAGQAVEAEGITQIRDGAGRITANLFNFSWATFSHCQVDTMTPVTLNTEGTQGACSDPTSCRTFNVFTLNDGTRTIDSTRSPSMISHIIVHSTNDVTFWPTAKSACYLWSGVADEVFVKARDASAHYLIGRDGAIIQIVDEDRKTPHAGVTDNCQRNGPSGFDENDPSIGIELSHTIEATDPYTAEQLYSLNRLVRHLMAKYGIPIPLLPRVPPTNAQMENASDFLLTHQEVNRQCGKTDPSDNISIDGLVAGLLIQRYQAPLRPTVAAIDEAANGIGDLVLGTILNGDIWRNSFTEDIPTGLLATVSSSLEIGNTAVVAEYKSASFPCPPGDIFGVQVWGIASRQPGTIYLNLKDDGNSCAAPPGFDIQQVISGVTDTWEPNVLSAWNPAELVTVDSSGELWGSRGMDMFTIEPGNNITGIHTTGDSSSLLGKPAFSFGPSGAVVAPDVATRTCTASEGAVWSNVSGSFLPLASVNDLNEAFPNPCNVRLTSTVINPSADLIYGYEVNSASILELSQINAGGAAEEIRIFIPGGLVREKLDLSGIPSSGFSGILMGLEDRLFFHTSSLPNFGGTPLVLIVKTR